VEMLCSYFREVWDSNPGWFTRYSDLGFKWVS
jgi:hypothetical protein